VKAEEVNRSPGVLGLREFRLEPVDEAGSSLIKALPSCDGCAVCTDSGRHGRVCSLSALGLGRAGADGAEYLEGCRV
jgi:hypothetical protein